jgi:hypothetical protein
VWLPTYDRFVLIYSADSSDAFGYCDFALGTVAARKGWRRDVRRILVADWRAQFDGWEQQPWSDLWDTGQISEREAMAWRARAWRGHEGLTGE